MYLTLTMAANGYLEPFYSLYSEVKPIVISLAERKDVSSQCRFDYHEGKMYILVYNGYIGTNYLVIL